jgi:LmbE family N-acetylglucosaminyl deacetylase
VYIYGTDNPNTWVDITDTIELKLAALREHASQLGDWDPRDRVTTRNAAMGQEKGMVYAEKYRVITLVRDESAD